MDQDPRTRGPFESSTTTPRFTLKVLVKWTEGSLIAYGWIQEKLCRVTIARPNIVAGLPERE
jgi:hypothetical protein